MDAEFLADLLNSDGCRFPRNRCCEYQLRQTRSNETQLHEPIDASAGLNPIGIKPEMLLDISKGSFYLPPLPIVFKDFGYLERHVCCKDTEISIRF